MGFFSWTCAKCGKSIMNGYAVHDNGHRPARDCEAVLVTPDSVHATSCYQGYGVIGVDVYAWCGDGSRDLGIDRHYGDAPCPPNRVIKVLHQRCYTGQAYEDLPASKNSLGQGYWEDD